jgi:hypothetical protein
MARPLSLSVWLLTAGMTFALEAQPRQPEVVCDLGPVLVATIETGTLRAREAVDTVRITFRDIDPKAGTARVIFGEGASGEEFAAVTVDANAITYLVERAGVFKMIVTTGNKATVEGWPAMMSQHGSSGGELTMRTAAGSCRMRAR